MPFQMQARAIEVLSVTLGKVRIGTEDKPVILMTYRPNPSHSPASAIVAITKEQAQRIREDLNSILDADESQISWNATCVIDNCE